MTLPAPARGQQARRWVELLLAVALSLFAALVVLGGVIQATGHGESRHESRTGGLVLAVVFLLVLVGCVRWAAHAEHAIRHRNPASPARAATLPPLPGMRRGRGRGRYAPVMVAIVLLEFVGGFVACAVAAPMLHGEWTRTQRVQQHGMPAFGTVTQVHNRRHTSKSSTWYTATVAVHLFRDVDGHATTVAHFPHATGLQPGAGVQVLLDPRNPGYAEFRGYPDTGRGEWIAATVIAVLLGLLDTLFAWSVVHQLRHGRWHRRVGLVPPVPSGA